MGHLKDVQDGTLQPDFAQELVDALWLKYSGVGVDDLCQHGRLFCWVQPVPEPDRWRKTRSGQDGTNAVTFMAMKATEECKTHQPGLSVRVQADCPREFMDAVTHLVSTGTAFRVGAAGRAGIRDKGHFL